MSRPMTIGKGGFGIQIDFFLKNRRGGGVLSDGQRVEETLANRLSLASLGDQATAIFLLSIPRRASLCQVKWLGHEKLPHAS